MSTLCFLCDSTKSRSYHRFPRSPHMRPIWKSICNLDPSDNVESLRLCSNHFSADDYTMQKTRVVLKKNAYPTINVNSSLLPRYDANLRANSENVHGLVTFAIEEILRNSEENANERLTLPSSNGLNCKGEPAINKEEGELSLCDHCGVVYSGKYHPQQKKTASKNSRIVNRIIAEEEKKYRCRFCSKKFANKGYLGRHEKNHTVDKDDEFYSKWLSKRKNIKLGRQIERAKKAAKKNYQCLSCPKKFFLLSNLKIHEKRHPAVEDDVEPFYNKILHKKFLFTSALSEDASF